MKDVCKDCYRERRGPRGKIKQQAHDLDRQLTRLLHSGSYNAPALVEIINRTIREIRQVAATGADYSDQLRLVRQAIVENGCRTVEEIVEEKNLSRWVVDRALQRLLADKVIETRPGYSHEVDDGEPGRPVTEYHPADDPTGQDFTDRLHSAAEDSLL